MQHPSFKAPQSEWRQWADEHFPFDGRSARYATGFDAIRATSDRLLAADMALNMCRTLPQSKTDPVDRIPPMPEWMQPDRRLPPEPEQGSFAEWMREQERTG